MDDRIPALSGNSHMDMARWFSDMADSGLIFHPEENAGGIIETATGQPMFNSGEAAHADAVIAGFAARFGEQAMLDAAYPHFMRAAGFSAH